MKTLDVLIIGAGPAGMAAAESAADLGASVVILDEQPGPGGQIYRSITDVGLEHARLLGADYENGRALAGAINHKSIQHETRAVVWRVDEDGTVTYAKDGGSHQVRGRQLILATGAIERPVPVPGWTMPGVMLAGAAQTLLKTPGLVAENAVLAGSGPLLYVLGSQMIAAGCAPSALIETQSLSNHLNTVKYVGGAVRGWRAIVKGLGLLAKIRKAGVRRYTGARNIRINGDDEVDTVTFTSSGKEQAVACSTVFLHQGVIPNTQITRSLGLAHRWSDLQRCFHPETDRFGGTSNPVINIAGDGAGIGGAMAAEYAGRLAAFGAAQKLDLIDGARRDALAAVPAKKRANERAIRPFLDTLYMPPNEMLRPHDETIVCRCEEVTAGEVRQYAKIGCIGPNQTKAFGRCGMGPCQGRYCGTTVTEILATENGLTPDETGAYRIRAPLKPVTLQELADLSETAME